MKIVKLAELNNYIQQPVIRVIIIQSQNVQYFAERSDHDTAWAFTVRDSPRDTMTVKFMGDRFNMRKLYKRFHVGDVVDIRSPKIYVREYGHQTERYFPATSSAYFLWCHSDFAEICPCTEEESKEYAYLMHIPSNDISSCIFLDHVITFGKMLDENHVNLLVVVLAISRKQILYKSTMPAPKFVKTLTVMDRTLMEFQITLSDDDNIYRSGKWIPHKTVLFIADARVQCNKLFFVKKTIVTENPLIPQTQVLQDFFSVPDDSDTSSLDHLTSSNPDIMDDGLALSAEHSEIHDAAKPDGSVVMSVREILKNTVVKPPPGLYTRPRPFIATLHCYILDKHLDSYVDILMFTCNECNEIASQYGCYDWSCSSSNSSQPSIPKVHFGCNIQLADQTGSLRCRMIGQIATDILGQTPQEYMTRTKVEYNRLKRFFIHNQFEAKVLVTPVVSAQPHIRIISLTRL